MEHLRIGILAPPWIPVPPPAYGGIEAVLATLGAALVRRGHAVRMVAPEGSRIAGVEIVETPLPTLPMGDVVGDFAHALAGLDALRDVDVVLDHSGVAAAALADAHPVPMLHVCHGSSVGVLGQVYVGLARRVRTLRLVAISETQRRSLPPAATVGVCHNGLDVDDVPFGDGGGGYLAFVGRMAPEKAPDAAIRIARAAGLPLRMAAKCRDEREQAYFDARVRPLLGPDVEWLGEIDHAARGQLLADALALVFPITWEEPFGMVMIEAMAAGTPVLATPRGAAPEIVVDGVTGYLRHGEAELAGAAGRVGAIDRSACRAHVERHFSGTAMARAYERVIRTTLEDAHTPTALAG